MTDPAVRRAIAKGLGIPDHAINDVLADPWCQAQLDRLAPIIERAAHKLSEGGHDDP